MRSKEPTGIERTLAGLSQWSGSPLVRDRIRVAAGFFHRNGIKEDYLGSIDFAHEVREETLRPGFHLVGFRNGPIPGAMSRNPFGLFYAGLGSSSQEIGIRPDHRIYTRFIVARAAAALRSRAGGDGPAWGLPGGAPRYLAGGGGWQYIVPGASGVLRKI